MQDHDSRTITQLGSQLGPERCAALSGFLRQQGALSSAWIFAPACRDLPEMLADFPGFLHQLSPKERAQLASLAPGPRRIQWLEGRRALAQAREAVQSELAGAAATLHASLSHSAGHVFAVCVATANLQLHGVGVDLEPTDRVVSLAVLRRIGAEHELELGLSALQIWNVKEACFKANPRNPGTLLPQYKIVAFDPRSGCGQAVFEGFPLAFRVFSSDRWSAAVACALATRAG